MNYVTIKPQHDRPYRYEVFVDRKEFHHVLDIKIELDASDITGTLIMIRPLLNDDGSVSQKSVENGTFYTHTMKFEKFCIKEDSLIFSNEDIK